MFTTALVSCLKTRWFVYGFSLGYMHGITISDQIEVIENSRKSQPLDKLVFFYKIQCVIVISRYT